MLGGAIQAVFGSRAEPLGFAIPLLFWMETSLHPPLWVHAAVWLPVSLILALVLLRPVKGATLGLMLRLGMVKADDE